RGAAGLRWVAFLAAPLHDPGGFVSEHDGHLRGPLPLHEVEVGVAQPRRDRADEHLPRPGVADLDASDAERAGALLEARGLHDPDSATPLSAASVSAMPCWVTGFTPSRYSV